MINLFVFFLNVSTSFFGLLVRFFFFYHIFVTIAADNTIGLYSTKNRMKGIFLYFEMILHSE